jgi:hypothetical protein
MGIGIRFKRSDLEFGVGKSKLKKRVTTVPALFEITRI